MNLSFSNRGWGMTWPEMMNAAEEMHFSGIELYDIFRTPWKALKVFTIGGVDANLKDELIVEVPGKGFVIAIPYVNERNMPKGLFQALLDDVKDKNHDNMPVIMTAHTTVMGCDFAGHENATELSVGGIDAYNLDDLGTGYDYLALGHIHHGQFVQGGHHRVRYSGTPIPISFDENYAHSVSIVEIAGHGKEPTVKEIVIEARRPLVTLPAKGVATWKDAKTLLEKFPSDMDAYIRLNVEVEDFLPVEASAEAQQICEQKKCRFCVINTQRSKPTERKAKVLSVQEFKTEEPIDIAMRYAEDLGKEFDDDMKDLFKETLNLLKEESRM